MRLGLGHGGAIDRMNEPISGALGRLTAQCGQAFLTIRAELLTHYRRALALAPDNPKIMSNLALSYALDGKPVLAEDLLRKAALLPDADARVRHNLMLVLGVQGKFDEAEKLVSSDTPKALVDSNREYFKAMLSPARSWETLRGAQN